MAGIGIQLNKIFSKRSVAAALYGVFCSITFTIAPMLIIIGCLLGMYKALGFDTVGGMERELFSCTILYIFIFSLLTSSPFNSVLSKYMTDRIYLERFEDVRPCIYFGIIVNILFSAALGIPFCLYAFFAGRIPAYFVLTSFIGYISLSLVFCSMIFNNILKAYRKISAYFILGMAVAFLSSLLFRYAFRFSIIYSMLLALSIGFLLIAIAEIVNALAPFKSNSYDYRSVMLYFRRYRSLIAANFLYTFGLFAHNFVFWGHPWRLVVANTYVCNQPYDMASCIAMFTNLSATTFFITRVEMHFRDRYADYMQSIIGGKLDTIEKNKDRMFQSLGAQLLSLARMQFTVSVAVYPFVMILMPLLGGSGMTMRIYPLLAVGYFISFLYYSNLLFLYYFNDLSGAALSALIFAAVSLGASLLSRALPPAWFGTGFTLAGFAAFTFSFFRLRWLERNLDYFIYCRGSVMEKGKGAKPSSLVYKAH
ncbi:MAG: exopolysaccharide Pel transporter PelG [Bacillota bacterium]|jgi:uncharacterized membrane protein|nr:exopolysaccharide Pel transporter PelG [Bacillota bacterium]